MSKGKQPRTRVNKVPKLFLSEKKVVIIKYNQEIGLEAAIFLRTRNRALVSDISTENLTDLNNIPKLCPHLNIIIIIVICRGSRTLGYIRFGIFKIQIKKTQVIMVT